MDETDHAKNLLQLQGPDSPETALAKLIKEGLALSALGLIVHVFSFAFQLGYLRAFGLPSDLVSLGIASVYTAGFWVVVALLVHFVVLLMPHGEGVLLTCLTVFAIPAIFRLLLSVDVPYPLWFAAGGVWLIEYGVPYVQFGGQAEPTGSGADTLTTKVASISRYPALVHSLLALMVAYPVELGRYFLGRCESLPPPDRLVDQAKQRLSRAEKSDKDLLGPVFGRLLGPRWLVCFALYAPTVAYCLGAARARTDDVFLTGYLESERWVVVKVLDGKAALLQLQGQTATLTGKLQFVELNELKDARVERTGPLLGHPRASAR